MDGICSTLQNATENVEQSQAWPESMKDLLNEKFFFETQEAEKVV